MANDHFYCVFLNNEKISEQISWRIDTCPRRLDQQTQSFMDQFTYFRLFLDFCHLSCTSWNFIRPLAPTFHDSACAVHFVSTFSLSLLPAETLLISTTIYLSCIFHLHTHAKLTFFQVLSLWSTYSWKFPKHTHLHIKVWRPTEGKNNSQSPCRPPPSLSLLYPSFSSLLLSQSPHCHSFSTFLGSTLRPSLVWKKLLSLFFLSLTCECLSGLKIFLSVWALKQTPFFFTVSSSEVAF